MSSPSRSALAEVASNVDRTPGYATLLKPFEVVGFWSAVALPFLYVPLLVTGPNTPGEQTALVTLVLVHVAALLLGHRHRSD
ncbi:hypothetical protein [Halobacterium zhouii]|uniref:hypothetical protein n=1 Tax=Halobacterium zhouii TaxID=2902624 RepID=UPI001E2919DA|nr:hypothetical protein [Halobacterium zhouii]